MMQTIPIDLDKIGTTLGLETRWYVSDTPAQLKHLFSELYSVAETEPIGYFKIKAIGVAALRDAEVLIFDEPTSGLDYKNMESVAGILSALSKRGKAILVISHDNELLMKICSRVIRMDEKTSS